MIEIFEGHVTDPTSTDYWRKRLNGNSALAELELKTNLAQSVRSDCLLSHITAVQINGESTVARLKTQA